MSPPKLSQPLCQEWHNWKKEWYHIYKQNFGFRGTIDTKNIFNQEAVCSGKGKNGTGFKISGQSIQMCWLFKGIWL